MRSLIRSARAALYLLGMTFSVVALVGIVLWASAIAINSVARWSALRAAAIEATPEAQRERAKDNMLVIAVEGERATGFLALRYLPDQNQVFGIAVPDAAFIEVPGQGFVRAGDSFTAGPESVLAAMANFFGVPFTMYAIVEMTAYQAALTGQDVSGLLGNASDTNLDEETFARWRDALAAVPVDNVALVPLPVSPLTVGSQTYFEPQRDEIADLVEAWWGVAFDAEDRAVRVIIYNGSGVPGIAGVAAQQLIRSGFRVVDTKNADHFGYAETQIVVAHGDKSSGEGVRQTLGAGEVVLQPAEQRVADIIVIIGEDFKPAE